MTEQASPYLEVTILEAADDFARLTNHHRIALSHPAQLALELVKVMSLVPVPEPVPAGSPADYSQRLRVMQPDEIAERAVELSRCLFDRIEAAGWTVRLPPFDDLRRGEKATVGFGSHK